MVPLDHRSFKADTCEPFVVDRTWLIAFIGRSSILTHFGTASSSVVQKKHFIPVINPSSIFQFALVSFLL